MNHAGCEYLLTRPARLAWHEYKTLQDIDTTSLWSRILYLFVRCVISWEIDDGIHIATAVNVPGLLEGRQMSNMISVFKTWMLYAVCRVGHEEESSTGGRRVYTLSCFKTDFYVMRLRVILEFSCFRLDMSYCLVWFPVDFTRVLAFTPLYHC